MFLAKTDMYEVIQLINSNDINKATGPDRISAKIVKMQKLLVKKLKHLTSQTFVISSY